MIKEFKDLKIEELKNIYEMLIKTFLNNCENDSITNEYYNDDGEDNYISWLEDHKIGLKNE